MTKLEELEKLVKDHDSKIADLKSDALLELKKLIKEKAALYEKLTGKNLLAETKAVTTDGKQRNRLTDAERAALPIQLLEIINSEANGIKFGDIFAKIEGKPESSVQAALKKLVKDEKVILHDKRNFAKYFPVGATLPPVQSAKKATPKSAAKKAA